MIESNITEIAGLIHDTTINLVNELLANDTGIRKSTYLELIRLADLVLPVGDVNLLKKQVEATDDYYYFPEGVFFDPGKGSNDAT